ncbi:MAG: hypothetical protein ACRBCT_01200 [Alphaproteobacteria bacterium]
MKIRSKALALLCCPLFLAGCGEGYEMVKVDNYFPYGNERTAGSGYAYVLSSMLPKKELKVEEIADEAIEEVKRDWAPEIVEEVKVVEPAPAMEPEPIAPADDIFLGDGKK